MKQHDIHWSIRPLLEKAKEGDVEAQFTAAQHLWEGTRTVRDLSEAVFWYEQAAEQGHPEAQCNLAYAYATGQGTVVCPAKAFYWYQAASQVNDVRALRGLAACYANGFGTEASYRMAYALTEYALSLQFGFAKDGRGFDRW